MASRSAIACSSPSPWRAELRQRGGRQLDGGVERQRRELLALRLLHRLSLLFGELAQAAEKILGIPAEKRNRLPCLKHREGSPACAADRTAL